MAIFHLSAKILSRSKGQSAIASAAYRSGDRLHDERYDETQDYTNKRFIEHSEIQLPDNAPAEYRNRERLWNSVEKAERAKNAQLAREIEVALPRELSPEQRIQLVHDYVQSNFVDKGMIADWSIHNPQPDKDNPDKPTNPHAHIMLTLRSLRSNGSWAPKQTSHYELDQNGAKVPLIDPKTGEQKLGARNQRLWKRVKTSTNDWNNPKNVEKWREAWAKECNKYLAPDRQIDHRSYEKQGVNQIPTEHEGHYAQELERKNPGSSWKVAKNRAIREQNRLLARLLQEWRKIEKAINELKQRISRARNQEEAKISDRLAKYKRTLAGTRPAGQENQGTREPSTDTITAQINNRLTQQREREANSRESTANLDAQRVQQRRRADRKGQRIQPSSPAITFGKPKGNRER